MTVGMLSFGASVVGANAWLPLRVGAGGYIRGMDLVASDDTMVGRTDTYGAWKWNSALSAPNGGAGMWVQLCSPDRFPAGDIASKTPDGQESFTASGGVWEIRIAPSNTSILYMGFLGNIYKSIDGGASWNPTAGWTTLTQNEMPSNNRNAQSGPKMAIDPINPNRVFLGTGLTAAGVLRKTLDGGTTYSVISTAQVAASAADAGNATGYNIAIDPRVSTQSGGNSQVIYVMSDGNGVYKSIDGGLNWTIQNSAGMPTSALDMKINPSNGDLWVVSNNGTTQSLYKYNGTTWLHVTAATSIGVPWSTIAIDPNNANNMVLFEQGANIMLVGTSTDGGVTWSVNGNGSLAATDIPWLAVDHPGLNPGRAYYDSTGKIIVSDGIGFWTMSQPPASAAFTITSRSAGVEQLITNQIISPPGGNPVVVSWDRAAFVITNPKQYPSTYYPGSKNSGTAATEIIAGWGADWASADPTFICVYADVQNPFYSLNKGVTWNDMTSTPPTRTGGAIAASTNQSMVVVTSNNGFPYYTANRGSAWTECTLPGVPRTATSASSIAIGTGTKVFTVAAGLTFPNGLSVSAADAANPFTNGLNGTVTSYSGTTLTLSISSVFGAGTISSWVIAPTQSGFGNAYYDNRQYITADRVAATTYYLYNDLYGVFRSTDGGVTWTLRNGTPGFVGNFGNIKTVPQLGSSTDTTGHLFFSAGEGSTIPHPANQPFYRSLDGGQTWPPVANVKEVLAFGFGKNDQSSVYPAIGFVGWYNGVSGVWVSKDNAVSFTKIGEITLYGTSDLPNTMTGDANTANVWYVGLHNSGSAYYGP